MFSCEYYEFFKNSFFIEHFGWLLLTNKQYTNEKYMKTYTNENYTNGKYTNEKYTKEKNI